MKYKHLIAIYLIGAIIGMAGALFKVMHWPNGSDLLIVSTAIQVVAVICGVVKVLKDKDVKSFLNR